MQLEHSFTVPVPVEDAWRVLLDVPRIAPCMPGATLTGVDGDAFTGTVKVKLGPIALTYQGKGRFLERDADAHRAVIEASGKDTRSAGTAAATVTAVLVPEGDATRVAVTTDLKVTGRPAQFGRSMIADVSAKLLGQFADCLAGTLTGPGETAGADPLPGGPAPAGPGAAAVAPAGEQPRTATEPAPTPGPAPAARAAPAEAEPIDLLKLTGSTPTARRVAAYGLGALVVALLGWLVVRWLRG
jgi:uncharacterized protein